MPPQPIRNPPISPKKSTWSRISLTLRGVRVSRESSPKTLTSHPEGGPCTQINMVTWRLFSAAVHWFKRAPRIGSSNHISRYFFEWRFQKTWLAWSNANFAFSQDWFQPDLLWMKPLFRTNEGVLKQTSKWKNKMFTFSDRLEYRV